METKSVLHWGEAGLCKELPAQVADLFVLKQNRTPNTYSSIGPKSNILVGWNVATLIGQ